MAEHLSSSIFIHPLLRIKHQVRIFEVNVFGINVFGIRVFVFDVFGINVFKINVSGVGVCSVLAVGLHLQQCAYKTADSAPEHPLSG